MPPFLLAHSRWCFWERNEVELLGLPSPRKRALGLTLAFRYASLHSPGCGACPSRLKSVFLIREAKCCSLTKYCSGHAGIQVLTSAGGLSWNFFGTMGNASGTDESPSVQVSRFARARNSNSNAYLSERNYASGLRSSVHFPSANVRHNPLDPPVNPALSVLPTHVRLPLRVVVGVSWFRNLPRPIHLVCARDILNTPPLLAAVALSFRTHTIPFCSSRRRRRSSTLGF